MQNFKRHQALFILLFALFIAAPSLGYRQPAPVHPIRTVEGKAVNVSDGDTFTVITATGTKLRVRTAFYDALETPKINKRTGQVNKPGQPFGEKVAAAFRQKIEGKTVVVEIIDIDRYKRAVGLVWIGQRLINLEMVREGWAQCYYNYLRPPYKAAFLEAEGLAKREKRGIWVLPDYEAPADFRKRQRIAGQ